MLDFMRNFLFFRIYTLIDNNMPDLDNVNYIIRILIIILVPFLIILGTLILAENASFSSSIDILNINLGNLKEFVLAFGVGFAFLSFFALLYAFAVRRSIHG